MARGDKALSGRVFMSHYWGGQGCMFLLLIVTMVFSILAWSESSSADRAIKRNTWGENGATDNCADTAAECKIVLYNQHRESCIHEAAEDGSECTSACYAGADDTCSLGECIGDPADAVGLCDATADCPNITFVAAPLYGQAYRACVDGICVYASGNATYHPNSTNCGGTYAQRLCEANLEAETTYAGCISSDSFCQVQTTPLKKRGVRRRSKDEHKKGWAEKVVDRIREIQEQEMSGNKKRGVTIDTLDNTCIYTFSAPLSESPFSS